MRGEACQLYLFMFVKKRRLSRQYHLFVIGAFQTYFLVHQDWGLFWSPSECFNLNWLCSPPSRLLNSFMGLIIIIDHHLNFHDKNAT